MLCFEGRFRLTWHHHTTARWQAVERWGQDRDEDGKKGMRGGKQAEIMQLLLKIERKLNTPLYTLFCIIRLFIVYNKFLKSFNSWTNPIHSNK